jgi:photosystem II stability/assembly factor-like uncharacterized protein
VAWGSAQEFYGRAVLCNTPHYPNEITWTQVYDDVDTTTKWTGYNKVGGTGVASALYGLARSTGRLIAVGDTGKVIGSGTLGFSWLPLTVPSTSAEIRAVSSAPDDTSQLWAVGGSENDTNYLIGSTNGGESWVRTTIGNEHGDFESNWHSVSVNDRGAIVLLGPSRAAIYWTIGGLSDDPYWNEYVSQSLDNDIGIVRGCTTYKVDDDNIWGHVVGSKADGGTTTRVWRKPLLTANEWSPGGTTITDDLFAVASIGRSPLVTIAVGANGAIYRNEITNTTWTKISDGVTTETLRAIGFRSTNTIFIVGDSGTVLKSKDAGLTFEDVSTGLSTAKNLYGVQVIARGRTDRVVVIGDAGFVAYSDNYGSTWTTPANESDEANRLIEAYYLGGDEEIRCTHKAHGLLYVFTDRNAYVFDQQFSQRSVTNGIEVFNDRCVAEYGGKFWLLGKYNGVNGLYVWDGVNQPVLASRPFQTLLDSITLDAAPRSVIFKVDTESEMTPPTTGIGIWFNTDYFTYEDGVMVLHKGATGTIYSHADTAGTPSLYEGYYVADMNNTSSNATVASFGTLGVEIALNETALTTPNVYCKVYARVAPSETVGGQVRAESANWTDWQLLTDGNNAGSTPDDSLPYSGQDDVFARYNLHIDHTKFTDYVAANEPYQWIQFKIVGGNVTEYTSNWRLNRVILRPQVRLLSDTSITVPNLTVWDDKLFVSLGKLTTIDALARNGLIVSNGGATMAETSHAAITSTTPHGGRMIYGMTVSDGGDPYILYTQDSTTDIDGFTSQVTTGRINLSDIDPRYAHIRKKLKRIYLVARPRFGEVATVYVDWWPDGRAALKQRQTLTFNDQHAPIYNVPSSPAAPEYQYREIEVSSPYQTGTGGVAQYASNYGHDFTIRIQTVNPSYIDLYQLAVEFEMATPDVKESDGAAEL